MPVDGLCRHVAEPLGGRAGPPAVGSPVEMIGSPLIIRGKPEQPPGSLEWDTDLADAPEPIEQCPHMRTLHHSSSFVEPTRHQWPKPPQ